MHCCFATAPCLHCDDLARVSDENEKASGPGWIDNDVVENIGSPRTKPLEGKHKAMSHPAEGSAGRGRPKDQHERQEDSLCD
jgi:hypothetical protein